MAEGDSMRLGKLRTRGLSSASVILTLLYVGCASGGGNRPPMLDAGDDDGGADSSADTAADSGGADSNVPDGMMRPDMGLGDTRVPTPDGGCTADGDCADGDACNGDEACVAGECVGGTPMDCADEIACSIDRCVGGACVHEPDNGMCVAPLTCTVDRGCVDAACTETPCRLVGPQCGCPTGEGCYSTGDERLCAPAGTSAEGTRCDDDICQPGNVCVNLADAGDPETTLCKRFCETDADCTGGAGSLCLSTLGMGDEMICTNHCDPALRTGCAPGTGCGFFRDETMRSLTDCSLAGTGTQEDPCSDDADCASGFACIEVRTGVSQCLRWCRRTPAGGECGFGELCNRLGETGIIFTGTEYGVCL